MSGVVGGRSGPEYSGRQREAQSNPQTKIAENHLKTHSPLNNGTAMCYEDIEVCHRGIGRTGDARRITRVCGNYKHTGSTVEKLPAQAPLLVNRSEIITSRDAAWPDIKLNDEFREWMGKRRRRSGS